VSWENAVVLDARTGRVTRVSEQPVVAEWSPDGSAIDFFGDPREESFRRRDRSLGAFYRLALGAAAPVPGVVMDASTLRASGWLVFPWLHFGLMALSPGGSRLAVLEGTATPREAALRVFDLKGRGPAALDRPARSIPVPDLVVALEWSPDETRMAALALGGEGAVAYKVVDLASGRWTTLRPVNIHPKAGVGWIDFLGAAKLMSWTR
jgi:hypothetical protein